MTEYVYIIVVQFRLHNDTGKWFQIQRRQIVFLWCDQDFDIGR